MLAKRYRLSERETKKVLHKGKPFFSHLFVASVMTNRVGYIRFAVILSGKHVRTSVARNFFRRRYYDSVAPTKESRSYDVVVRAKKWVVLDAKNPDCVRNFDESLSAIVRAVVS